MEIGDFVSKVFLWHHWDVIHDMFVQVLLVCIKQGDTYLFSITTQSNPEDTFLYFSGDGNHYLAKGGYKNGFECRGLTNPLHYT